ADPTHASSASATSMTLPSAGATTAPGTSGARRSGSRKNPRKASASADAALAGAHLPTTARIHAAAAGGKMKGHPSLATGIRTPSSARAEGWPPGSRSRLDPRHHLAQAAADFLDRMLGVAF